MSVTFRTKPLSRRLALYADCEALLPLENSSDVATLFNELCQELKPIGLLEESQIATIGRLLWRKYHLEIFLLAEQARVESYREQREKMAAASASPAQQALEAASKKRKPLEEDDKWQERLADLADLRNLDLASLPQRSRNTRTTRRRHRARPGSPRKISEEADDGVAVAAGGPSSRCRLGPRAAVNHGRQSKGAVTCKSRT